MARNTWLWDSYWARGLRPRDSRFRDKGRCVTPEVTLQEAIPYEETRFAVATNLLISLEILARCWFMCFCLFTDYRCLASKSGVLRVREDLSQIDSSCFQNLPHLWNFLDAVRYIVWASAVGSDLLISLKIWARCWFICFCLFTCFRCLASKLGVLRMRKDLSLIDRAGFQNLPHPWNFLDTSRYILWVKH